MTRTDIVAHLNNSIPKLLFKIYSRKAHLEQQEQYNGSEAVKQSGFIYW